VTRGANSELVTPCSCFVLQLTRSIPLLALMRLIIVLLRMTLLSRLLVFRDHFYLSGDKEERLRLWETAFQTVVLPLVKEVQKNPGWLEFHHKDHEVRRRWGRRAGAGQRGALAVGEGCGRLRTAGAGVWRGQLQRSGQRRCGRAARTGSASPVARALLTRLISGHWPHINPPVWCSRGRRVRALRWSSPCRDGQGWWPAGSQTTFPKSGAHCVRRTPLLANVV
jgi:hypothetical protein